jgi:FlaA1/EpsC-like NDP-sugar epimerase
MELFLFNASLRVPVSTARFANVAFSDGSLLHGFSVRMAKRQPISAPRDVKRFFVTQEESGLLCLLSCLLGDNREIFFPKLDPSQSMLTFSEIAVRFLASQGYEPALCQTEDEARSMAHDMRPDDQRWPCYFFNSDTTGEKAFEEFYAEHNDVDLTRFPRVGVIRNAAYEDRAKLDRFLGEVTAMRDKCEWTKSRLVKLFGEMVPEFAHMETGKYLDDRM